MYLPRTPVSGIFNKACPTMNETTVEDLYLTLKSIEDGKPINEIIVDERTIEYANLALERMLEIS